MTRAASSFVVLAVLVFLAPFGRARAQSVDDARALYHAANFQEAVPAFEAVLASESATRGDVLSAHRHLAALHEMQGASDRAIVHARAAVALDPAVTAPEGAPPEVTALLDRARDELGGPAELAVGTPDGPLGYELPGRVRAHLARAPDGLFARVRLSCDGGGGRATVASAAAREVTAEVTARSATVRCDATAATAAGAVLLDVSRTLPVEGAPDALLAGSSDGSVGPTDDEEAAAPIWPWLLAAGGALVLAGAIVAVVLVAQPDQASFGGARIEGW